ncbi:MAG: 4-(cytidine 5'-diphospho)-2-C-methyl-D-erythritol kinase [Spirochaetes bacterium]|nr:4-(cytidine 5'-diphospho)-2-C-methyl-D-erythritol kinase [Spirochaetota bacterium]
MKYTLLTSAKVNLGLTVVGKLPDGYHEIESIFLPISIYDKLECSFNLENNTKELKVIFENSLFEGSEIPEDSRNIVWKVVEFVEKTLGVEMGFDIKIYKRIPTKAGLGGGSGNGGGVLLSLLRFLEENRLLKQDKKELILSSIHTIGSDIPFFLRKGGCIVRGKGEKIREVRGLVEVLKDYTVIVVYPNFSVSTAEAYRYISDNKLYDKHRWADEIASRIIRNQINIHNLRGLLKNTFELFIIDRVEKIKNEFYLLGALFAMMSGSGSSVYGIFDEGLDVERIIKKLSQRINLTNDRFFASRFVEAPVEFI